MPEVIEMTDKIHQMIQFRFQSDCETVSRMRELTLYDAQPKVFRSRMADVAWDYQEQGLGIALEDDSEDDFLAGHLCDDSEVSREIKRKDSSDSFLWRQL